MTENPEYLSTQLITCIGNKRALLPFIGEGVAIARGRLGKPAGEGLDILDAFAGSGVVSRYLKREARRLVSNDLERYSEAVGRSHLANSGALDLPRLREVHAELVARLETGPLEAGFIAELYAPVDDADPRPGERVFYTRRNALFIDSARRLLEGLPAADRDFFLGPLLAEASVHANTAGVFKGFYRDARTGVGRFGGSKSDALARIRGPVALPFPVMSRFECEVEVRRGDALEAARAAGRLDVAYLDPPYNQHPYGSNYFMLNLVADYERPSAVSEVSGIPGDWLRSDYNARRGAKAALEALVEALDASFVLLSFNSEGFFTLEELRAMLERRGRVEVLERDHPVFRGSRNLHARGKRLSEYLFVLEKE